jgi:hypothetical protein
LSPVSITGVTPSAFSSATACADEGLMVSATAQMARPVRSGQQRDGAARLLMHCQAGFEFGRALPALFDPAVVGQHIGWPSITPCTPRPATA